MHLDGLDHATIRCPPTALPALHGFYCDLLGLTEGRRPDFDFPGHWLYLGGRPVLHLAGRDGPPPPAGPASGYDHLAFRARGLAATRARLAAEGIDFQEAPVPGFPLMQIFLRDPLGLRVELTFDLADPDNRA